MNKINQFFYQMSQRKRGLHSNRDFNKWVFGEWFGKRCCDNSLYLANYVVENNKNVEVYWITRENVELQDLHENVNVVIMDSKQAEELLLNAGVFVFNQGVGDVSSKYEYFCCGAVIVNLWHGVAWKKIAMDSLSGVKLLYHSFLMKKHNISLYLAQSDYQMKINESAFCVKKEQCLLTGSPRNSLFYEDTRVYKREVIRSINEKYGTCFDENTKIITYMPTFRDSSGYMFSFEEIQAEVQNILLRNDAIIVQKAHFAANVKINDKLDNDVRIFNYNDYPAQKLLAATDVLVTDYSSCFFDFLLLNRPIIHFIYDYDYYLNKDRGLYCTKDEVLCGSECIDKNDLCDILEDNLQNPTKYEELRLRRREKYMQYEKNNSCDDIYDAILKEIQKVTKNGN